MRLISVLLTCLLLSGCAMHRYGQLHAPKVGVIPSIRSLSDADAPSPQQAQATFAPQIVIGDVGVWSVHACTGAAVSIEDIYRVAVQHGISPIEPSTAQKLLSTRTPLGVIVQIGGYGAGGAAVGVQLAKANTAWVAGLSVASAILGWLIPALERDAPTVPCTGQDLLVNTLGCGAVMFCAQPSPVGAFVAVLK